MWRPGGLLPYPIVLLAGLAGCAYLFPSCQTIPNCPVGQVLCNNLSCSDLRTDPFNCGFCNNVCSAGLACADAGPAAPAVCGCAVAGQTNVNGACLDFSSDPQNCGTIGHACRSDQTCAGGSCGCPSASYLDAGNVECPTPAGSRCTQLTADPLNCGACGTVCDVSCVAGSCSDAGLVGSDDGGGSDAGTDGGLGDGGDAGVGDGGLEDAGPSDGGTGDAGPLDAGADAG